MWKLLFKRMIECCSSSEQTAFDGITETKYPRFPGDTSLEECSCCEYVMSEEYGRTKLWQTVTTKAGLAFS